MSGGEVKAILIWGLAEQQICLKVRLDFQMEDNISVNLTFLVLRLYPLYQQVIKVYIKTAIQ
jgi:hypothetical protein